MTDVLNRDRFVPHAASEVTIPAREGAADEPTAVHADPRGIWPVRGPTLVLIAATDWCYINR
jgi:hypothetical protein